ncbi:hypothetical protein [Ilumatobacter sp.]|uniref:hypothetical protein n=1 Tax=Ilumatobacter sp. TaxID=1967498 RepID=UPI003C6A7C1C
MESERDPDVLSRTMLIGAVAATIALLLLGLPWPVAALAGIGGYFVSQATSRKLAVRPELDDDADDQSAGDGEVVVRDDADPETGEAVMDRTETDDDDPDGDDVETPPR